MNIECLVPMWLQVIRDMINQGVLGVWTFYLIEAEWRIYASKK